MAATLQAICASRSVVHDGAVSAWVPGAEVDRTESSYDFDDVASGAAIEESAGVPGHTRPMGEIDGAAGQVWTAWAGAWGF